MKIPSLWLRYLWLCAKTFLPFQPGNPPELSLDDKISSEENDEEKKEAEPNVPVPVTRLEFSWDDDSHPNSPPTTQPSQKKKRRGRGGKKAKQKI